MNFLWFWNWVTHIFQEFTNLLTAFLYENVYWFALKYDWSLISFFLIQLHLKPFTFWWFIVLLHHCLYISNYYYTNYCQIIHNIKNYPINATFHHFHKFLNNFWKFDQFRVRGFLKSLCEKWWYKSDCEYGSTRDLY